MAEKSRDAKQHSGASPRGAEALAAQHESDLRLRQLVDNIHQIVWLSDPDKSTMLYVSPAYEKIFERTVESLYANPKSFLDAIHPEDRERIAASMPQQSQGGYQQQYRIVRGDGSIRWLRARAYPISDASGRVYRIAGVTEDITESREMLRNLERREKQFRTLLENIPGVVYRCACDEHWTMEFISDAIEELSGYPADEFIGNRVRSYASIIHPEDRAIVQRAVEQGIAARTPYIIDYRVIDAAGNTRSVYEKGQGIFDEDGKLLWLDGAIFDVTDRRAAETKIRAEQALLRQLLDLGERERKLLAYDIHDGFVQDVVGTKMMLEALIANDDAVGPKLAERLGRLIDLLAHAIDEGRRVISELRPLIIDEHGILAAIRYLVGDSQPPGAPLKIDFKHDVRFERLPPLVEGTVFRIVQEALNNIRRHSNASTARIRLTQPAGEEALRIEVSDNGVGFDHASVPQDRFGLRGMVERARLLGGCASIESTLGRGTRVLVELPLDGPG